MNLGEDWIEPLKADGYEAIHWSSVGEIAALDREIMEWASANDHVILTADLDFGTLLAASDARWPSVVQLRTKDTLPSLVGDKVRTALRNAEGELLSGALVTIDVDRFRVRPLPIRPALQGSAPNG